MGFKERLTQLRKELNLTQEQLAEKLGIGYTRTAISAWEVGRNEPSNEDTIKIANFFGVSTDFLLGKSDIRNPEQQIKDEFSFAYHKETEGLSEDEIKEALEFYKRIKYGKNKEKQNETKDNINNKKNKERKNKGV